MTSTENVNQTIVEANFYRAYRYLHGYWPRAVAIYFATCIALWVFWQAIILMNTGRSADEDTGVLLIVLAIVIAAVDGALIWFNHKTTTEMKAKYKEYLEKHLSEQPQPASEQP